MKNICGILKQKEADLARVRQEVESLRIVVPLVLEDLNSGQSDTHLMSTDDLMDIVRQHDPDSKAAATDDLSSSSARPDVFWNRLKQTK